ncbi:MAG: tRNA (guanosine(46)-N7)-methyltransferase TrmB [Clostridia bacterium]|nr:tRNA (guanosine(46)-N7)-methyltransferase TrmB [Clostridia bacterium]
MRMRHKKHLTERLDAVSDILFVSEHEDRNFNTAVLKKEYIDISKWFGNNNPVFLEIGCGKGGFAVEYARGHRDINVIAVEKDANVIVSACELCKSENIQNLKFIKCAAEYLEKYIKPNSISGIFLNFSCPFPKNKYASHRLTSSRFLEIYKRIMAPGAKIEQKTDNMHFFEFSIEQLSFAGFNLQNISLDLHNSDFENNIVTEYESRFAAQGLPIYRLEAYIPT